MDACLDQASDQKHGRYNPVAEFERVNGSFDGGLTLTMLIGDCSLAFERLPWSRIWICSATFYIPASGPNGPLPANRTQPT